MDTSHDTSYSNPISTIRLAWRLYVMTPVKWRRYLYSAILKREPEDGIIAEHLHDDSLYHTARKVEEIINFVESDEARAQHGDSYVAKLHLFCEGLGYGHAYRYVAQQLLMMYPEDNNIFTQVSEVVNIISANTERMYHELESDNGSSADQIAVNIDLLLHSIERLSLKVQSLEDSANSLRWNIADLRGSPAHPHTPKDTVTREIAEMMSVLIERTAGK